MTQIIILAAGKGKRMGIDKPKVLASLKDKALIEYLLDSVIETKIDKKPIVVVSPDNYDIISENLKNYNLEYAIQKEQLGTGHAVESAKDLIDENVEKVVVLYGDHPFIKSSSIKNLASLEISSLAIMPTKVKDYNDWRKNFYHWGRIIRNNNNDIEKIVEFKDSGDEEKKVLEVNPGIMAFNKSWLFENLSGLDNDNKQKEYYLTDLVKKSFAQNKKIKSINIEPEEAVGINSKEELSLAYKVYNNYATNS